MDPAASRRLDLAIRGPIARADLPGLCDRVCALLASAPAGAEVHCDVQGVPADGVSVDALCRLQLAARRRGCLVLLRHCSPELRDLVGLLGLRDVLPEARRRRGAAAGRRGGTGGRCPGRR